MGHHKWQWILVASGALVLWGCDDGSSSSRSTPATGNTQDAVDVADDATDTADDTADTADDAATEAESKLSILMKTAQPLLDKVTAYVKDNKYELASKALAQLEGMGGLPDSFMSKIKDARSLIDLKMKADQAEETGKALQGLLGK